MSREVVADYCGLRSRGLRVLSIGRSPQGPAIFRLLKRATPSDSSEVQRQAPKRSSIPCGGGAATERQLGGLESSCFSRHFVGAIPANRYSVPKLSFP